MIRLQGCGCLQIRAALQDRQPTAAVFLICGHETAEAYLPMTDRGAALFLISGMTWNDLSPWPAPPVFGKEAFTGKAAEILAQLEDAVSCCTVWLSAQGFDMPQERILAGYSLAGLFSLWCGFSSRTFTQIASISGSLWFDGFVNWARDHLASFVPHTVYLSVGDREKRTRNPRMALVQEHTRLCEQMLREHRVNATFETNPGGHFQAPEQRTLRGVYALLDRMAAAASNTQYQ